MTFAALKLQINGIIQCSPFRAWLLTAVGMTVGMGMAEGFLLFVGIAESYCPAGYMGSSQPAPTAEAAAPRQREIADASRKH